jgi:hypothetical protein
MARLSATTVVSGTSARNAMAHPSVPMVVSGVCAQTVMVRVSACTAARRPTAQTASDRRSATTDYRSPSARCVGGVSFANVGRARTIAMMGGVQTVSIGFFLVILGASTEMTRSVGLGFIWIDTPRSRAGPSTSLIAAVGTSSPMPLSR